MFVLPNGGPCFGAAPTRARHLSCSAVQAMAPWTVASEKKSTSPAPREEAGHATCLRQDLGSMAWNRLSGQRGLAILVTGQGVMKR